MSEIKVSVIMPFHNGADYIEETMSYVTKQTLKEIEIICVDDASTDHTVALLENWEQKDDRIKVVSQNKSNAGVARNTGMEHATGEYLLFLDSDDLFEADMLEKMYEQAKLSDADVCVCNADQFDTTMKNYIAKPQYMRTTYLPEKRPFSKADIGKYILYFTTSVPWNKLVKFDFLKENNIRFQDIERANDQYFSIMCLVLAGKIDIVEDILVHYRVRQKDNLTTKLSETPLCAYEALKHTRNRLLELNALQDENVACAFDNKVLNVMIYSLNSQSVAEAFKEQFNRIKSCGEQELGIVKREPDYYFNALEYDNLCYILEYEYDQYLVVKSKEYRQRIEEKNVKYRQMVQEKNEKIAQLKEKEKELNEIKKKNWFQKITRWIDWYHRTFKLKEYSQEK